MLLLLLTLFLRAPLVHQIALLAPLAWMYCGVGSMNSAVSLKRRHTFKSTTQLC
jgi:hypothetical protein